MKREKTSPEKINRQGCAIRPYGRFCKDLKAMNDFNRPAYVTALNGLLASATDEQLDRLWSIAAKMILESLEEDAE